MDASKLGSPLRLSAWAAAALLTLGLVATPLALRADDEAKPQPASSIDRELARVAALPLAEQQAWLRQIESRFARAVAIVMPPADAVAQQKRMRGLIYRKLIRWDDLRQMISETDAREKEAIEALVRKCDAVASDKLHQSGSVIDSQPYRDWKTAADAAAQERLIVWLDTRLQDLERQASQRVVEQKPHEEPPKVASKPAIAKQPDTKPEQPAQQKAAAQPTTTTPPVVQPTMPATPPKMANKPVISPSAKAAEKVVDKRSENPFDEPATETPIAAKPEQKTPPAPKADDRRVAAKKPAADDLWKPAAEPAKRPTSPATKKPERAEQPQAGSEPVANVQIDVDELAARIAGCNLEFRGLETALDEKGTWNAAKLEPMVDRLKLLVLRHHDLSLFRASLSDDKRASMTKLESPKTAVAQVAAKIVEIRKQVNDSTIRSADERETELAKLDALSRRLAEISAGE